MINTEEFLMGEKEVLNQWKGLLVRQCSDHTYTIYSAFVSVVLTKNNRFIKHSSLLSSYNLDFGSVHALKHKIMEWKLE